MRLTVGPLPPAVYWRRRALVLGTVLLVLFLVAQACMAASAAPDRRGAESSPSASPPVPSAPASSPPAVGGLPTSTPEADADDDEPTDDVPVGEDLGAEGCTDEEILVEAEASPATLPVGGSAQFTLGYYNGSDRSCLRDVGADLRELSLRRGSGADWVWSSRHCIDLRGRDVQRLEPGVEHRREHWIDWNGRASDSCDGNEPAGELVPPGEYELVARVGTAYSEPVTVTVTEGS